MRKKLSLYVLLAFSSLGLLAEWQAPIIVNPTQTILSPNLPSVSSSQREFSMSPSGIQVVVWANSGTNSFFAATRIGNGNWSSGVTLASGGTIASNAYVSTDDAGNAIAIWAYDHGSGAVVESNFFNVVTGTWEPTAEVIPDSSGATFATVAMNGSGSSLAVFRVGTSLFYSVRPAFGTWSPSNSIPAAAGVDSTGQGIYLGIDALGNGLLAWNVPPFPFSVRAATFVNGSWSAAIPLSLAGSAGGVVLAVNPNGEAVIAWQNLIGGISREVVVTGNIRTNTWTPATILPPVLDSSFQVVAINNAGDAAVIWFTGDTYVSTKSASSTSWATPTKLSLVGGGTSNNCWIAMDDAGNTLAGWFESQGGTTFIRVATQMGINSSWSTPTTLATQTSLAQVLPPVFVGMDQFGNASAVWNFTPNSVNWSVQSAYAPNLLPILSPTQITGRQIQNRYLKQLDLVNVLQWQASTASDVVSYRILRDGVFLAQVPATFPLIYRDHNRIQHRTYLYEVQAINGEGNASSTLSITLP